MNVIFNKLIFNETDLRWGDINYKYWDGLDSNPDEVLYVKPGGLDVGDFSPFIIDRFKTQLLSERNPFWYRRHTQGGNGLSQEAKNLLEAVYGMRSFEGIEEVYATA